MHIRKMIFQSNYVVSVSGWLVRRIWNFDGQAYADVAVEDGDDWQYPFPGVVIRAPGNEAVTVYIRYRLYSTLSGLSATWCVGPEAEHVINAAPYQPEIRGYFREFVWWPPRTRPNARQFYYYDPAQWEEDHPSGVIQTGSGVLNWAAVAYPAEFQPEPDATVKVQYPTVGHLRQYLAQVAGAVSMTAPAAQQGALTLWRDPTGIRLDQLHVFAERNMLFNHYFPTGRVVARWGADTFLIVVTDRGPVLALDHETVFIKPGVYIARHPLPSAGVD